MRRERAALQQLHYAEIETLKQQHAEHIHHLKTKAEADMKEDSAALRHSLELKLNDRERQLVDAHRRDKEEEALNSSRHLAQELQRQHDEWKSMSEQQMQRIREKHAGEMANFDQSETELRNKMMEIRRSLTDRDEELASLRLTLFQHVKENGQLKKTLEQFNSERCDLRNVLLKEVEGDLEQLEAEKRQIQEEFTKFKSEQRMQMSRKHSEMAQQSTCHEKMLSDIHEKVKQAVSKKDEALSQMQQKLQAALSRCQHLEELIDRQHRDLLNK